MSTTGWTLMTARSNDEHADVAPSYVMVPTDEFEAAGPRVEFFRETREACPDVSSISFDSLGVWLEDIPDGLLTAEEFNAVLEEMPVQIPCVRAEEIADSTHVIRTGNEEFEVRQSLWLWTATEGQAPGEFESQLFFKSRDDV